MNEADKIRIQHMIDAAREALDFSDKKTINDFERNRMLVLSVIKDIEIIGEAASKITPQTKEKFSEVPWNDIIGMRNRLIHGYFDVDIIIIWQTVNHDLPELLTSLQKII